MTYPSKTISITINRPLDEVYQFASNPENLPGWVAFIKIINKNGDTWLATTDLGEIRIMFVVPNHFGVIDHLVTLANGETINNPMRVIANGTGAELVFTVFRLPGRTEEDFNKDAGAVESDLKTLKKIMENKDIE